MKPPQARRKCLNCKELFLPDYRNAQRQGYCLKAECRKARKRESQRAWLTKPENQNYFRDEKNAERVRNWQKDHPGYWKNTARYRRRTLQDLCSMQIPLFVGLISMFVGSTLPDDIATSTRRLLVKGHDILGTVPGMNFQRLLHEKTCPQSGATPESPPTVQLDRPPAGAGKLLPSV